MSIKIVSIVALAVGLLAAATIITGVIHTKSMSKERQLWEDYKRENRLAFDSLEEERRLYIFRQNLDKIAAHNAKQSSYELGITPFTHLTREEFSNNYLGFNGQNIQVSTEVDQNDEFSAINATVDWVKEGAVTHVKNQGQCGSCWSFSTTGSLEGLNYIKNKKLISLSEQQLMDCSDSYGNQGCNGGLMDQAFEYVQAKGITANVNYPYTAEDGKCQKNKPVTFKITGHQDVQKNSNKALLQAIKQQPVSVAIEADQDCFQLYKKGVITGDACGTQLDHGVLAVGYGTLNNKNYILVKNSWGPSWGLSGYVLIGQANGAGVCGINSAASYPTLKK